MPESSYKKLLLIICVIAMSMKLSSQTLIPYFLNTSNGLSSDHVYNIIEDQFGYLWIATTKGVMKYNGYTLKKFASEEGLYNEDVWNLYEDKKGRMWFSSVSPEIGYVKNNKYQKAVNVDGTVLYPIEIYDNNNGNIFFGSRPHIPKHERNDSIFTSQLNLPRLNYLIFLTPDGVVILKDMAWYHYKLKSGRIAVKKICEYDFEIPLAMFDDNIIFRPSFYTKKTKTPRILNISSGKETLLRIGENEHILTLNKVNLKYYFTSEKHIYEFDLKTELFHSVAVVDTFLNNGILETQNVLLFSENSFWGKRITSSTQGLAFADIRQAFHGDLQVNNSLKYIGENNNSIYWWDIDQKSLLVKKRDKSTYKSIHGIERVVRFIYYSKDTSILVTLNNFVWVDKDKIIKQVIPKEKNTQSITGAYIRNRKELYEINSSVWLFRRVIYPNLEIGNPEFVDSSRYTSLEYDSIRDIMIFYSNSYLFLKKGNKSLKIDLTQFGTENKIEQILADNIYGNIIVKIQHKLWYYIPEKQQFRELFEKTNLKSSSTFIRRGKVIVAGKFGVLYSKINGFGEFSEPFIIANSKNMSFNFLNNIYTYSDGGLELITDKGRIYVITPDDSIFKIRVGTVEVRCKLTINYRDTIYAYKTGSTINIDQKITDIKFDLINPFGTGDVKYEYRIDNLSRNWFPLTGNELNVYSFRPDQYYTISIRAYDNIIRTGVYKIKLYIVPYWWQTRMGKYIIGTGILLLLLTTILSAIHLTKRRIMRRNAENNLKLEVRNLHLDMELKSIHAQINPHFIFNTLNTGLYFIKKRRIDEAFTHIASFSQLLRSYLKSSRNKYITLKEEIVNLQNYISLQQARFDNKFTYNIIAPSYTDSIKIPTLLLQPLVENAINHGLLHKEGAGELNIEFRHNMDTQELICIIDDNGIGRAKAKAIRLQSELTTPSYGSDLVKELIATFNKHESVHLNIEYIDKQFPLEGTTVIITIQSLSNDKK